MHSNYKNVTDLPTVYKYINNSEIVAFDYETAPDEEYRQEEKAALDPHKAHVVGCSFSVLQGTGIYVPIAHKTGQNADKDEFFVFLRDFLTDEGIIKVAHNLSFESQMSYAMGIVIKPPVYDTMSAAQMTLKSPYEFRGLHEYGIPIDYPLMLERKAQAERERNRIKEKIAFIIGDIPIGENCSTQAFKDYLFKNLELPVLKMTSSNKESVDDVTLIMLKEWCQNNKPELSELFTLVQEYRKWGKIKSTYIDGYIKHINSVTKNIHPNIFSLSTDTGRMNCQNPNAQNMPRKTNDPIGVRNFIKAPENSLILSLDFSQIELRVGAFYCKDEVMNRIYRQGGDIHAATTSVIFGCSYEEAQDKHNPLYKERRTIAKNVNFGTFYGLFLKDCKRL